MKLAIFEAMRVTVCVTTFAATWAAICAAICAAIFGTACITVAVPDIPQRTLAPPKKTAPAATEVCWIETASADAPGFLSIAGDSEIGTWHATVSVLLVKHPAGDLIVDTGSSATFDRDLEELDKGTATRVRLASGWLVPRGRIVEDLQAAGARMDGLRILLTHSHPDHTGGIALLPDVPVLLTDAEFAFVKAQARAGESDQVLPAHARAMRGRVETFGFPDGPYETFDESKDLYGDGSVVVVPSPGHTPGHVAVFVHLASGRRILHVGDVVLVEESVDRAQMKGTFISFLTDNSRAETAKMVAEIAQLHALDPELIILPAHDRDQWARAVAPRDSAAGPVCAR